MISGDVRADGVAVEPIVATGAFLPAIPYAVSACVASSLGATALGCPSVADTRGRITLRDSRQLLIDAMSVYAESLHARAAVNALGHSRRSLDWFASRATR